MNKIVAKDREHLESLIHQEMKKNGPNCNLNHIDVSNVTNMYRMFSNSRFNGDISEWDVSNVTDMSVMFTNSLFNGDISKWDVSNVTNMSRIFRSSQFNGDISKWDVSNVTDRSSMFKDTNNPTRFKWNFEKLLIDLKIKFDVNEEDKYSPRDHRMFRQNVLGMYE